ncbi:aquaporin [Muricauda sp. SCSIO 64092]|uniref:aquaporin n=1 Tax=Allomuricauda sp. SCSIO 64092 TaxID=2908842 RepID=UPI001FF32C64|nr:aquaporin [Muricauda sp. SCSIO 64092]UOY08038.1 aquaporin [Muricauda sp. SCSIO 64092]
MDKNIWPSLVAEFIGTFLLVFFGTGAIIVDGLYDGMVTHLGVAIVFGLVVLVVIYAIGEISGAHLNPAVTWAFFVAKRIEAPKAVWYTLTQIIAAIAASAILRAMFPETITMGETLPSNGLLPATIMEFILTFTLMFVIINVATGSKEQGLMAGLSIGFTVLICALMGGPVSGASMNPARSIGPALIGGNPTHLWMYVIVPLLGAISSIYVWKIITIKNS